MSIILTTKNTENPVSNTGQAPGLFNPYGPLRPSADTLPAFPIHCLPPRLQAYVAAVAEHTQTPVDMAAGVALGVLATCSQGKVRVEGNPGHYEQTSLYVFIVANPGARKSAVIEDYEQAYNEKLKPQIRKRRQERETLRRQINRLNRQLEQKYDSMIELELQHAQDNLADLPAIQPLQIFTDDCTSEMMVRLLKDNGGRMALISAEGGAFDAIIGRYSKKPNLDVWLKGICGDTIRVDRLNREPDYVRHPAVSMILTAQPSVLSEIMQNGMLDGRGWKAGIHLGGGQEPSGLPNQGCPDAAGLRDAGRLQARTAGEGAADADLPAIRGTVVGAVQAAQATAHDEDDLQKSAGQPYPAVLRQAAA